MDIDSVITPSNGQKLGEILLARQKLSRHDLERALEVQRSMGGRLGRLLISLGLVAEQDVYAALAHQAGLSLVRLDGFPQEKPETAQLNTSFLLANHLLPMGHVVADGPTPAFVSVDPKSRTTKRFAVGFWKITRITFRVGIRNCHTLG